MLESLDGNRVTNVAHAGAFASLLKQLGSERVEAVRSALNGIVEHMEPDKTTQRRKFNSSYLGSTLSPWPEPLSYLYDVAWELEGNNAPEEVVQDRAALFFGQFVWECLMKRPERWVFYDPNLSSRDPNREIIGKSYFEREPE